MKKVYIQPTMKCLECVEDTALLSGSITSADGVHAAPDLNGKNPLDDTNFGIGGSINDENDYGSKRYDWSWDD